MHTEKIKQLQQLLNLNGQSIPGVPILREGNKAASSKLSSSGNLLLKNLPPDGTWFNLSMGVAQLLPFMKGVKYKFSLPIKCSEKTNLKIQLRRSSKTGNYTPDVILETISKELLAGEQNIDFSFNETMPENEYGFVIFLANDNIQISQSSYRYTGILSVFNSINKAVSNLGKQTPPDGIGIDAFEFWIPLRRPAGKNFALQVEPAINCFGPENLVNGYVRPTIQPNAWIADNNDAEPAITISWEQPVIINEIKLFLDNDYDHPMESVLMGHPENEIPFCVRNFKIKNNDNVIAEVVNNHQTIVKCEVEKQQVQKLTIEFEHPDIYTPAAVFEIQIN
jgi:hypothetical protein